MPEPRKARGMREPEDLAWLEPRNLLFLCYGNICRSPFAAEYWNKHHGEPPAASAGFIEREGRTTPDSFRRLADEHGVNLHSHRARYATPDVIDEADVIFLMDGHNLGDLEARYPEAKNRTFLLGHFCVPPVEEIDDPFQLGERESREVYETIVKALQGIERVFQRSLPETY